MVDQQSILSPNIYGRPTMSKTLLEAGDTAANKSEIIYTSRTYLVTG